MQGERYICDRRQSGKKFIKTREQLICHRPNNFHITNFELPLFTVAVEIFNVIFHSN